MGGQKADIHALNEYCGILQRMMTQKTAGAEKKQKNGISFAQLDTICNIIVIEAMCLYLSRELDRLEGARALQDNRLLPLPLPELPKEEEFNAKE